MIGTVQIKEMVWHSVRRFVSVVCVLLVIVGIGWAIYVMAIKPHVNPVKTTSQRAEQIVNPTLEPKISPFGCVSIRVNEYYRKKE